MNYYGIISKLQCSNIVKTLMQYYYNIAIYQNDKTAKLQYHFMAIPQNYNSTIHQCDNTSKQQNHNEVLQ